MTTPYIDSTGKVNIPLKPTNHSDLEGLSEDDHSQYHTDARGDVRYYTQATVDSALDDKANLAGGNSFTGSQTFSNAELYVPNFGSIKSYNHNSGTVITIDEDNYTMNSIAGCLWHDLLAFNRNGVPTFEKYNGSSWVASTHNNILTAHKEELTYQVYDGTTYSGCRWTWNNTNFRYCSGRWLILGNGWSTNIPSHTVLVEGSSNGSDWYTLHSFGPSNLSQSPTFHWCSTYSLMEYFRVTLMNAAGDDGEKRLSSIRYLSYRWGSQGKGQEWEYPYDWDGDGNITPLGTVDGVDIASFKSDYDSHSIASHADTSATGAELNELTDGSVTTLHSHSGGGSFTLNAYMGLATTSQTQNAVGEIEINFDSDIKKDGAYTHSTSTNPNQITIGSDGWYEISYSISWDSDYGSRTCQRAWVEIDSSPINQSYSYCYLRYLTYGRFGTTSATFLVELTSSDVITLHADQQTTGGFGTTVNVDTIANQNWIYIKKMG
jgi:hypothetical protein